VLESIHAKLTKKPVALERLRKKAGLDADVFDKAVEKLVVHGGAVSSEDGEVTRGAAAWKPTYVAQRDHKLAQLQVMARFAESHGCRMVHMIRHFGDREDTGEPCGICDVCAPERCIARAASASRPRSSGRRSRGSSRRWPTAAGQATGRLHREAFADGTLDRRSFEHLLGGLVRAGLVTLTEASFEKDGKVIPYQRVALTPEARGPGAPAAGVALTITPAKKPRRTKSKPGAAKSRPGAAKSKPGATKSKWFFIHKHKKKRSPG
jgi:DNA topoisomerase-3